MKPYIAPSSTSRTRRGELFFMQYVDANGTIGNDDLPVVDKPMVYVVSGEADYFRRPQPAAKK